MLKKILKKIAYLSGHIVAKRNVKVENLEKYYDSIHKMYVDYTMIPSFIFTDNLILTANFSEVSGDVVECGVWRGGMIAGLAFLLGNTKKYYLFDSFEGLPDAKVIDGQGALDWQANKESLYYLNNCKAEMGFAEAAMKLSGAQNYTIVKGWFEDTLPNFNSENGIAVLRLDGDWYESTMVTLKFLFPQVNQGGLIIIDDYYVWDGCSRAVHDYLSENNLACRIYKTKNDVAYIIKT